MSDAPLMAVLYLEPHLLAELLHLPPGAELMHVEVDYERRGCLKLHVRGVGWPTLPGHTVMRCGPAIAVTKPTIASIDWGLPE